MNLANNSQDKTGQQLDPLRTHDLPTQDAMSEFMKTGWAADEEEIISAHPKSEDDRRLAHTYAERIKSA